MTRVDTRKWRRIIESGEDYPGCDPIVTAKIREENAQRARMSRVRSVPLWASTSVGAVPDQSVEEEPSPAVRVSFQASSIDGIPFERYVQAQEEWGFQTNYSDPGPIVKRN